VSTPHFGRLAAILLVFAVVVAAVRLAVCGSDATDDASPSSPPAAAGPTMIADFTGAVAALKAAGEHFHSGDATLLAAVRARDSEQRTKT
jgi:hypothetical protein